MKFGIIMLSLFMGLAPKANATGWLEVGNGGEALYCPSNYPFDAVYMSDSLDLERYHLKERKPDNVTADPIEIVGTLIARLPAEIRDRALELANSFYDEAHFSYEGPLRELSDGGNLFVVPEHCQVLQLIIQKPPEDGEKYFYLVDGESWQMMDSYQKAIAILHEVIYRMALSGGDVSSAKPVRHVVVLALADKFQYYHHWQNYRILVRLNMWPYDWAPEKPNSPWAWIPDPTAGY